MSVAYQNGGGNRQRPAVAILVDYYASEQKTDDFSKNSADTQS